MRLAAQWKFLGKGKKSISTLSAETSDALHDAGLLVVALLDQEGVVLDALGWPRIGRIANFRRIGAITSTLVLSMR